MREAPAGVRRSEKTLTSPALKCHARMAPQPGCKAGREEERHDDTRRRGADEAGRCGDSLLALGAAASLHGIVDAENQRAVALVEVLDQKMQQYVSRLEWRP